MAISVDHTLAFAKLQKAWASIDDPAVQPTRKMGRYIEEVMQAPDLTFKYILVTGFLAKSVKPQINARALQTRSSLNGAYDARSLCHKVVVGFEKSKGNLFGLSNEPFVNKPARHPEHDKHNLQLKSKKLAASLHEALECANRASSKNVFGGLVHILRLGSQRAADEKSVAIERRTTYSRVVTFINQFLATSDGGARLVAAWAAFVRLLSEGARVVVSSPNQPDLFAKSAGDVELFYKEVLVSASECKHRPLTVDDINHGVRKALERGCPEYLFVCASGSAKNQQSDIEQAIAQNSGELDLAVINFWNAMPVLTAALNPTRRVLYGSAVVDLLREMRKFESANAAAELWNRLDG